MRLSKRRLAGIGAALAIAGTAAVAILPASGASAAGKIKIGVALTYNNTAFWTAYISYEKQYAAKYGAQLLGPLLAGTNASLQNTQVEDLVNEGAKAVIVNPETATSMLPAIKYAAKHHVQLISVDTIVGARPRLHGGPRVEPRSMVRMRARTSSQHYPAGSYVIDLEGDLTSSNGADRTDGFNQCMQENAPNLKVLGGPDGVGGRDRDERHADGAERVRLEAHGDLRPVQRARPGGRRCCCRQGRSRQGGLIGDDGVAYEMCYINNGLMAGAQAQPANLYAQGAVEYALDAAKGVKLKVGQPGIGAPTLADVSFLNDTNLGDPIVGPLVTKTATHFNVKGIAGCTR